MTFPYYFHFGSLTIHPHLLFEILAYFIGFRLYLYTRNKQRLTMIQTMSIIAGAALGAALGSKLLYWLEDPLRTWQSWHDPTYLLAGKTIVGGLLGGLIAVEWVKKQMGIHLSTGDEMVYPLITAIAIGRIGCFLTGLPDQTYGTVTRWWTGVDFGDGVLRHPTQLYEIVFLILLAVALWILHQNCSFADGRLFQHFMVSYLTWRFLVDFIKPTPHPYGGLNQIQCACLLGIAYYIWLWLTTTVRKDTQHA